MHATSLVPWPLATHAYISIHQWAIIIALLQGLIPIAPNGFHKLDFASFPKIVKYIIREYIVLESALAPPYVGMTHWARLRWALRYGIESEGWYAFCFYTHTKVRTRDFGFQWGAWPACLIKLTRHGGSVMIASYFAKLLAMYLSLRASNKILIFTIEWEGKKRVTIFLKHSCT